MMSEQKQEKQEQKKPKTQKYKLLVNIKHNKTCYKIGDEIELNSKDEAEEFIKKGIVDGG